MQQVKSGGTGQSSIAAFLFDNFEKIYYTLMY